MKHKILASPTKEDVQKWRKGAGLTQDEAAGLVHLGAGTRWSEYETGARKIDIARWELFLVKIGIHPQFCEQNLIIDGKKMLASRYRNSSTYNNLNKILEIVRDVNCKKLILFASESTKNSDFDNVVDGPETNLPLLAAVALYSIHNIQEVAIVFDGTFLTAARRPRYLEVKALLDEIDQHPNSNIFFHNKPVTFTSSLEPAAAVSLLLEKRDLLPLNANTRPDYFRLLSYLSESELIA